MSARAALSPRSSPLLLVALLLPLLSFPAFAQLSNKRLSLCSSEGWYQIAHILYSKVLKGAGGSASSLPEGGRRRREFNRKILRGKPIRCRVISGRPALLGWRGRPRPSRTAPLGMTKTPTLQVSADMLVSQSRARSPPVGYGKSPSLSLSLLLTTIEQVQGLHEEARARSGRPRDTGGKRGAGEAGIEKAGAAQQPGQTQS